MGARERGRHRLKARSQGSTSQNSSRVSQNTSSAGLQVPTLDASFRAQALQGWQDFSNAATQFHKLSLSEEARNTQHGIGWSSGPLRGKGISFVSAGTLHREESPDQDTSQEKALEAQSDNATPEPNNEVTQEEPVNTTRQSITLPVRPDNKVTQEEPVNTTRQSVTLPVRPANESHSSVGQSGQATNGSSNNEKTRTVSVSSGSSDEVVFVGRGGARIPSVEPKPDHHQLQPAEVAAPSASLGSGSSVPAPAPAEGNSSVSVRSQPRDRPPRRILNSRFRRRLRRDQAEMDEEDAIMQDYINNLTMSDEDDDKNETPNTPARQNEHFRLNDSRGEANVKVQTASTSHKRSSGMDQAIDWSSSDLEMFDDLSTTDEEIVEVHQVLRKRQRDSGLQYLVHAPHTSASDAKWMLQKRLVSGSAREEIQIFEEMQAIKLEEADFEDASSSDEDEEALDDLIDTIESEDDENARIMRRTQKMTDEEIARILAKQEELGIGGDEVMLFDALAADDDEANSDEDDAFTRNDGFVPFSATKHTSNRTRAKRAKRKSDSFPSAEALADALDQDPYGGFDVMDYDRPSLKAMKKGRKGDLPFELAPEDADLAEQLHSSWVKDREKKAARKQAKMEARAVAMDGNDPESIKQAIRSFLVNEHRDELSLPVMPPHVRASVHRLAKCLSLNSRSHGKGDDRHPILTKTVRTHRYAIDTIWEIDALMNQRRFFPKGGMKAAKAPRTPTSTRRGGGGGGGWTSGAQYTEGEIVGGSAPEIGSENKGRAMLEKMGWTKGMGIGAIGNKGSTEVIQHVVKKTKAGLG